MSRRFAWLLLLPALAAANAAAAQLGVPRVVQRVIPRRGPPPPLIVGIDALRADFVAKTGSDTVYFVGDTYQLTPAARTTLGAQAQWLLAHPEVLVRIEGHADLSDTRDHALAIGARRAEVVRNALVLMGVPAAQMTTVTWGKERAPVQGSGEAALVRNRRAVTVLVR